MGQLPHAPPDLTAASSFAVTRRGEVRSMSGKAVVSLTTGLEDPEKVTVAFLVAVAAAEQERPTLMFLTKEAARRRTMYPGTYAAAAPDRAAVGMDRR